MSQFKKAMLKKYLSQEKEEENHSAAESEQQVGSAQNEQKILFLMHLCWKKNHHLHQCLQFPLFLLGNIGKYPLIPKI